ncbi:MULTISPECIES: ATP-binding protein [unclassified Pseudoxanthomonas]|uniref:AAA family ATPase n=1 Tax=unclassified Pseudoxanthomonas TaxID=2645906 RepID=UPI00160B08DB|nr:MULTISPECIES: ATP-binding protein [unclassified Pseudoxanthomonas]MBB3274846.1 putative ATPase [Pseudoxanthomonas sp. OG2]MBV7475262.1 AAA family ATPase [Pseudoxanthomonas sp. PXM05]
MLTRLRIKGFKNLIDVDIRFGPLTCIAGPNSVGKSNLFDAIRFLSELADKPFVEAARSIRGGEDIQSLFTARQDPRMELSAEMIISTEGFDDFGQPAEAGATFVRYDLVLSLDTSGEFHGSSRIRLDSEKLSYITKAESAEAIGFPHSKQWRDSVVRASARRTTFITTEVDPHRGAVVRLQSDRMRAEGMSQAGGGKAFAFSTKTLPRTVLSSAQNAEESRTAVLVRKEMRNWKLLQLEPSSLRGVDEFDSEQRIDATGAHIPATLWRLTSDKAEAEAASVTANISNSLSNLVERVRDVRVDKDEVRRTFRFMMTDAEGLELPASSLSDGTMRFVALAIIEQDPDETGLLCLEEPENGIHPQRIDAILDLLYRIVVDVDSPIGSDNPLRQIIVSTHSPLLASRVDRDDCVFARIRHHGIAAERFPGLQLVGLARSWRARLSTEFIADGDAIAYLRASGLLDSPVPFERTVAGMFRGQLNLPLYFGVDSP